jgi:hypothetical protein
VDRISLLVTGSLPAVGLLVGWQWKGIEEPDVFTLFLSSAAAWKRREGKDTGKRYVPVHETHHQPRRNRMLVVDSGTENNRRETLSSWDSFSVPDGKAQRIESRKRIPRTAEKESLSCPPSWSQSTASRRRGQGE